MKIAIQTTNGLSIMTVIDEGNVEECLTNWQAVHHDQYISHHEITDADIPADKTKRGQWYLDTAPPYIKIGPDPAPPVPETVSRFQARAALYQAGLFATVETLMANPNTNQLTKMAWQDALEFRRDSPTVSAMAAALNLSNDQLDQLFIAAAKITA